MLKLLLIRRHFFRFFKENHTLHVFLISSFVIFKSYGQTDSVRTVIPTDSVSNQTTISNNPNQTEKEIKGKVLDKEGEPIIGAIVTIKGTSIGTTTNENGEYTLKVPAANSEGTLVVSYVGYAPIELPLATTTNFDTTLQEDSKVLSDVVVIGYGTQEKEDVTGAISTVKGEDLAKIVVTDATQALQGRAPGVTITQNSGSPGSPLTIRVRGVGTTGNASPLFVVNGVPVGFDINYLNTNDIESIDVLKDASAAAIYGSRAANGVVLVTTKKGSPKKATFDFNILFGLSKEWKRYKLLDGHQWATLRNEAALGAGQNPSFNTDTIGAGTDWQKEVFQRAMMQSYHLGASGATEKSTYYVSGGYLQQGGIVKNSNYERYTFNINNTTQLSKRFTLGTFSNVAFSDRLIANDAGDYTSVISSALAMDPVTKVVATRGQDSSFAGGLGETVNPVALINNRTNRQKGINYLGSFYGEYKILKYVKLKSALGYSYNNATTSDFEARYFVKTGQSRDLSNVIRDQTTASTVIWENSAAFEKIFAEKHKFGALLLYGIQNSRSEYTRVTKSNTTNNDPNSQYFDAALKTDAFAEGTATENALLSYLARINYEYRNKYLFTANLRRDESSRFPKGKRAGLFPSVGAGWKISEEGFFEGIKPTISFLKLRAGWGKTGNQYLFGPSADYPYTTNVANRQNYSFGNNIVAGAASQSIGNPNITWEKVTTSNVALDFGFFRDRLTFTVDYFTRTTEDMLLRKQVPAIAGLENNPYINGGKVQNKGVELSAEYREQQGDFKYRVGANITFIKNKVIEVGDPIYDGTFRGNNLNITQNGGSIGEFYGYETDGIVQTEDEARALQSFQSGVKAGEFKYKDRNGDGVINDKDKTSLGSAIPKFTYGINADLSYKRFDLSVLFQGVSGNKIFNGSKYVLESPDMLNNNNKSTAMLDRWTGPGTSNTTPGVSLAPSKLGMAPSNYYIESGSYFRLKVLQIGYTIADKYTSKIKMTKLRVFVGAQNLLTFTKYTGLDPEIGQNNYSQVTGVRNPSPLDFGIDRGGNYPQARTWQIGLNASF
ncbi:MAG: TonB-dependent receptor [Opitutaceae bacterium]|nr:TonB-dependent receptor [Cytophagales bacterium]